MLTSWSHGEDAALWRIDDERIGILTVDFITPVVDDPRRFGEIAAANSLSDVFAMGGRPLVALNIVGFPTSCQPIGVLQEILLGGADKVIEAGAVLAGGHSVQDEEPKYGLVVFGEVRSGREWRVDGARQGDLLILTKPIGTGIAATAIKAGLFPNDAAAVAVRNMCQLNDWTKCAFTDEQLRCIHSCTDVTGFGLAGHALDMVGDGLTLSISMDSLPVLPGVWEMSSMGLIPAGGYSNREHSGARVSIEIESSEKMTFASDVFFDPQTSGGLLFAVERDAANEILSAVRNIFPDSALIGEFTERSVGGAELRVIE